ncbi:LSU ribosomal protein L36p [Psychrobacter sp. JCM 18902]|nr:LSU ribosomal protein L36p [Psychrobacter sp. JCM 18902]
MKVQASVKKICGSCKVVRRKGVYISSVQQNLATSNVKVNI